jgi:hypothetical protein
MASPDAERHPRDFVRTVITKDVHFCSELLHRRRTHEKLVALQLATDFCEVDGTPCRWTATRRRSGKKQFIQPAIVTILWERPAQDPPPKLVLDDDER